MSQDIRAIFDNGVFRPLDRLEIPEGSHVKLRVDEVEKSSCADEQLGSAEIQRQLDALHAMFAQVDQIAQTPCRDGLSGRDHDQILYGTNK